VAGFGIFGKVSVDGSALNQIAAQTKAAFAPAAMNVGQQFKAGIMQYISAGAIGASVKKTIDAAMDIRSGANKAGVDTDRYQTMKRVADDAGESVDTLVQILKDGGTPAEELTENLKKAEEQMKATGQIVESETVKNLAELGDKLKDLFGKIAPILSWVIDKLSEAYQNLSKLANLAVAGGTILWGKITGDKDLVQSGREHARETVNSITHPESKDSSPSATAKAANDIAAEKSDQERRANLRKLMDDNRKKEEDRMKHPAVLPVSSLTAAGAIFGPMMRAGGNPQIDESNRYLRAIEAKIGKI
jgi:hypothetical protein